MTEDETMNLSHAITDYDIQAYVDNELCHEKSKVIQNYITINEEATRRYKQLIEQKRLLKMWWQSETH